MLICFDTNITSTATMPYQRSIWQFIYCICLMVFRWDPQQESRDLMLNCPQNHILSNAQTQKQIAYRSLPILHADDGVPQ